MRDPPSFLALVVVQMVVGHTAVTKKLWEREVETTGNYLKGLLLLRP
jgi:hypothetical protein